MEGRLEYLSQQFRNAVSDFLSSLEIDLSSLDPRTSDAVMNGHIQKFEFCIELLWKTIRAFILEIHGYDVSSPKGVLKKYFELGHVDYATLEALLQGVDLRNTLSHVYKKEFFKEAHKQIVTYGPLFRSILEKVLF